MVLKTSVDTLKYSPTQTNHFIYVNVIHDHSRLKQRQSQETWNYTWSWYRPLNVASDAKTSVSSYTVSRRMSHIMPESPRLLTLSDQSRQHGVITLNVHVEHVLSLCQFFFHLKLIIVKLSLNENIPLISDARSNYSQAWLCRRNSIP